MLGSRVHDGTDTLWSSSNVDKRQWHDSFSMIQINQQVKQKRILAELLVVVKTSRRKVSLCKNEPCYDTSKSS